MSADTRLRELLNEIAPPPEVPEAPVAAARAALRAAYRDVASPPATRRRRFSFAWATAAGVTAAAIAAALLLPGSTPTVEASLAEIARAARAAEDLAADDVPAGSFVYSHLDHIAQSGWQIEEGTPEVAYLMSTSVDRWVQGSVEEAVITIHAPIFFDPAIEAAYYEAGRNIEDGVGETVTRRLGDIAVDQDIAMWSEDLGTLRKQIDDELATAVTPALGEDIRLLLLVEELMEPRLNAPAGLRAALIEVLGSRDVATTQLADGAVLVSLEYEDRVLGGFVQELEFDRVGYLRGSRSIAVEPGPVLAVPPGTVIEQSKWSRPYVVDGAGVLPAGS